jgi:hypothetical protein
VSQAHVASAPRDGIFIVRSPIVYRRAKLLRYGNDMAENNRYDLRVNHVKQRLHDELVDEQGRAADPDDVSRVVDAKAESFADAPVQEFVPLLIEHQARDELRQHGLHLDLGDVDEDASPDDRADGGPHEST